MTDITSPMANNPKSLCTLTTLLTYSKPTNMKVLHAFWICLAVVSCEKNIPSPDVQPPSYKTLNGKWDIYEVKRFDNNSSVTDTTTIEIGYPRFQSSMSFDSTGNNHQFYKHWSNGPIDVYDFKLDKSGDSTYFYEPHSSGTYYLPSTFGGSFLGSMNKTFITKWGNDTCWVYSYKYIENFGSVSFIMKMNKVL